jgi:N-acetylglucosaminyldiphosphoundecaprenol N-acetyl-beta-D-mannosaminyltransferase
MPEDAGYVRVLGVRVDALTYDTLLEAIEAFIGTGEPHHLCTVNPEFVMEAQRNPTFRQVLEAADLCLADGVGLLWAARRQGRTLPARVTGSDGVPLIAARAAQRGWRLFLLGAADGVAARAAEILRVEHPTLQIAGTYAGSPDLREAPEIIRRIRDANADVLLVAYGAPRQDLWIARHRTELKVPVMMGVGGSFDHIAGVRKRAPEWMRRANLEWMYRLLTQPWRWRRQLDLPRFAWRVLRSGNR